MDIQKWLREIFAPAVTVQVNIPVQDMPQVNVASPSVTVNATLQTATNPRTARCPWCLEFIFEGAQRCPHCTNMIG